MHALTSGVIIYSAAAQLAHLKRWRSALSARAALADLQQRADTTALLALYRHFFPNEFRRSTAAWLGADCAYSPREWEFLTLVDQRLFPLALWWLQELENFHERTTVIPVQAFGLENWDVYLQDDDISLSIRVMQALLFGEDESDDWDKLLAQIPGAPRPANAGWGWAYHLDSARLERLCRRAGGPMAAAPQVLRYIDHATDNFWLDYPEGEGQQAHLPWTAETVAELARLWHLAEPMFDRILATRRWFDAQPARLGQLITFWNRVCTLKPPASA